MRRWLLLLVLAVVWLGATTAQAAAPPGPRLGFIRYELRRVTPQDLTSNHIDAYNLLTADALGTQPQFLLGYTLGTTITPFSGPSWSPDGLFIAIGGVPDSSPGFSPVGDIYVLGADGSGLRQVTQLGDASDPVFSSDGKTIYFARTKVGQIPKSARTVSIPTATSIWAIGTDGAGLRRLTPARWRVVDAPGSVSPLTGDLAFSRFIFNRLRFRYSARVISPVTGTGTLLAPNAVAPAYSPDGRQVALASLPDHNWPRRSPRDRHPHLATELYVRNLATGATHRLTRTRLVSEGPFAWDPSGQRIAYIRGTDEAARLLEINADGSCPTALSKKPRRHLKFSSGPLYRGIAWQPGAGREAGRIAC
jgi:Tol biopolymer transport system component